MRKLLMAGGLLIVAVMVACETKTPSGPGRVTVSQTTSSTTTTTSIIPTTTTTSSSTSTTTTTTTVPGGTARRYVAFQPPPNVPADMTLFFELLGGSPTENEYRVTGVYVMKNGTVGDVRGELGDAADPLETGGQFEGTLTAKMPGNCTAEREFAGRLTSQMLEWTGGRTIRDCTGSPLSAFQSFSLLRADTAPLPTTTISP